MVTDDAMLEIQRRFRIIMRYAALSVIPTCEELQPLAVNNMKRLLGRGGPLPGQPPAASRSQMSKQLKSGYSYKLTKDGSIAEFWWGADWFLNVRGRLVNPAWIEFGHGGPAPAPPHPFMRPTATYLEQITPGILSKNWLRLRDKAIKKLGNAGGASSTNLNVDITTTDVEMNYA